MVDIKLIKKLPKADLHDHLDGSLRPQTVIELAEKENVNLPAKTPEGIADWFQSCADRKNLKLYLEGFSLIEALLQDADSLKRVAFEAIIDRKKENIIYTELRFAPSKHTQKRLSLDQVVEAVLSGMEEAAKKENIFYGLILCAMRDASDSLEIAKLALKYRDSGVVGFDLAGDEAEYPAVLHLEAFKHIRENNFNLTIHAGEASGADSIWQALQICGCDRIGHGTRLIDDIKISSKNEINPGRLASYIKNKKIPLEVCISSNIHTGAVTCVQEHPFGIYYKNRFTVCLCTDNRLMDNTTLSDEYFLAAKTFSLSVSDLKQITINAINSSFQHLDKKNEIIEKIILPEYHRYEQLNEKEEKTCSELTHISIL